jgi:hypothetical protein
MTVLHNLGPLMAALFFVSGDNGGRKDKRPNIGVRPFGGIKIAMI